MSVARTRVVRLAVVVGALGSLAPTVGSWRPHVPGALAAGCASRATVPLRLQSEHEDALVTIDDQYVAKLGEIARRSIKLPPGTYRLTVEKNGYFPFDRIIVVDAEPVTLAVDLEKIPD